MQATVYQTNVATTPTVFEVLLNNFRSDVINWLQGKVDFFLDLASQQHLTGNEPGVDFHIGVAVQYGELVSNVRKMNVFELTAWAVTDYQQIS